MIFSFVPDTPAWDCGNWERVEIKLVLLCKVVFDTFFVVPNKSLAFSSWVWLKLETCGKNILTQQGCQVNRNLRIFFYDQSMWPSVKILNKYFCFNYFRVSNRFQSYFVDEGFFSISNYTSRPVTWVRSSINSIAISSSLFIGHRRQRWWLTLLFPRTLL